MDDLIGQFMGNYRLTRLLGRGGFAGVYLAEHRYLGPQAHAMRNELSPHWLCALQVLAVFHVDTRTHLDS